MRKEIETCFLLFLLVEGINENCKIYFYVRDTYGTTHVTDIFLPQFSTSSLKFINKGGIWAVWIYVGWQRGGPLNKTPELIQWLMQMTKCVQNQTVYHTQLKRPDAPQNFLGNQAYTWHFLLSEWRKRALEVYKSVTNWSLVFCC